VIVGIVGTGTIACGLMRAAEGRAEIRVLARSAEGVRRAVAVAPGGGVPIDTSIDVLAGAGVVVARLDAAMPDDVVFATTTSSLSIVELAELSGRPGRFAGLHVFSPVHRMPLVELVAHGTCDPATLQRLDELCAAFDKTAVVVPDTPGFVVNALLFPYLFAAVELADRSGVAPEDVDCCMRLGAGHPMGPFELLDMVGLDVALAIGHNLGLPVPPALVRLVGAGHLGRKSGRGFLDHTKETRHDPRNGHHAGAGSRVAARGRALRSA
jgi:3-hydroxyacyl-CoA dehydrogenase